jgi:hypothetical protein
MLRHHMMSGGQLPDGHGFRRPHPRRGGDGPRRMDQGMNRKPRKTLTNA